MVKIAGQARNDKKWRDLIDVIAGFRRVGIN